MEIKVYSIKLNLPRGLRNTIVYAILPLATLLGALATVRAAATLTTFTAGTPIKATDVNANFTALNAALVNLDGRLGALETQAHTQSGFHATVTTVVSIPSGATTPVVFDRVDYDLAKTNGSTAEYDTLTGAFVPKTAGVYLLHCELEYLIPTAATVDWAVVLYKNGSQLGSSDLQLNGIAASVPITQQIVLAAGDSVVCRGFHNSATAVSLYLGGGDIRNSFSAARLY